MLVKAVAGERIDLEMPNVFMLAATYNAPSG